MLQHTSGITSHTNPVTSTPPEDDSLAIKANEEAKRTEAEAIEEVTKIPAPSDISVVMRDAMEEEVIDDAHGIPSSPNVIMDPVVELEGTKEDGEESRHPVYYFEDGNVTFKVEGKLYKLHRSILKLHTTNLRSIIPQYTTQSMSHEESKLTHLQNTRCIDFERFLWILYPPSVYPSPHAFANNLIEVSVLGELKASNAEEWTSVYLIAKQWQFNSVQKLAISR